MEAFGLLRRVTCGLFRAVLNPDVRFPYVRARKTCFLAAHMAQHKRNMAPGRPSMETFESHMEVFLNSYRQGSRNQVLADIAQHRRNTVTERPKVFGRLQAVSEPA